jgi:hypothetical protein
MVGFLQILREEKYYGELGHVERLENMGYTLIGKEKERKV